MPSPEQARNEECENGKATADEQSEQDRKHKFAAGHPENFSEPFSRLNSTRPRLTRISLFCASRLRVNPYSATHRPFRSA
jgi:hypothetical protein